MPHVVNRNAYLVTTEQKDGTRTYACADHEALLYLLSRLENEGRIPLVHGERDGLPDSRHFRVARPFHIYSTER